MAYKILKLVERKSENYRDCDRAFVDHQGNEVFKEYSWNNYWQRDFEQHLNQVVVCRIEKGKNPMFVELATVEEKLPFIEAE